MNDLSRGIDALRGLQEAELLHLLGQTLARFEHTYLPSCAGELASRRGWSADMVRFGLERAVAALNADSLSRWLRESQEEAGVKMPARSRVVLQVLASNVPGLALPAAFECLLARCPVLLKAGEGDRFTPQALTQALWETHPVFHRAVDCAYWKGGDVEMEHRALEQSDWVVASGRSETMEALRHRIAQPLVEHGHKISMGVVGPGWQDAGQEWWNEVVRECVLWEQGGCLSPRFLCVEGDVEQCAQRLAEGFRYWESQWAPPAVSEARVVAMRSFRTAFEMEAEGTSGWMGESFTVGWKRQGALYLEPPSRCLAVYPMEWTQAILRDHGSMIQALGVAFDPSLEGEPSLPRFPLNRIQDPPSGWRPDGHALLVSLLEGSVR